MPKQVAAAPAQTFSFCETIHAGPATPWHIRKLSPLGIKLQGGADTASLCGRKVAWDIQTQISIHNLLHCCQRCAAEFEKGTGGKV